MLVKNGTLIVPKEGEMRADLAVSGGTIAAILEDSSGIEAGSTYDAGATTRPRLQPAR